MQLNVKNIFCLENRIKSKLFINQAVAGVMVLRILFLFLFFCTCIFSQSSEELRGELLSKNHEPSYNLPASIETEDSWGASIYGAFLLYQAFERGLDLGSFGTPPSSIYKMKFNYKPAFEVAASKTFKFNECTLLACYKRYYASNHRRVFQPSDSLVSYWLVADQLLNEISAKWRLKLNDFNLTVGRAYYCGRASIVTPAFGLKGIWMKQIFNVKQYYEGENYYKTSTKSNSWFVGPLANVEGRMVFKNGWFIFGDVGLSLLYQHLSSSWKEENGSIGEYDLLLDKRNCVVPYSNLKGGFGWGTYFAKNSWYFAFRTAWNFEAYFEQNSLRWLKDRAAGTTMGAEMGNLYLQGLLVACEFDF